MPLLDYFTDPETPVGILDLVYGLYMLYGLLRGLFRGFAKESASILGTVITLWGAWTFYPAVSKRLMDNNLLDNEMASQVLAYVLLVFMILALWRLVTALLNQVLSGTMPAQLQRSGGAIVGFLKAGVAIVILLVAAQLSQVEALQEHMIDHSAFGRLVRDNITLEGVPTPGRTLREEPEHESGNP